MASANTRVYPAGCFFFILRPILAWATCDDLLVCQLARRFCCCIWPLLKDFLRNKNIDTLSLFALCHPVTRCKFKASSKTINKKMGDLDGSGGDGGGRATEAGQSGNADGDGRASEAGRGGNADGDERPSEAERGGNTDGGGRPSQAGRGTKRQSFSGHRPSTELTKVYNGNNGGVDVADQDGNGCTSEAGQGKKRKASTDIYLQPQMPKVHNGKMGGAATRKVGGTATRMATGALRKLGGAATRMATGALRKLGAARNAKLH